MPFYFSKYEFTKEEQAAFERKCGLNNEVPLETEISDEYMVFPSSSNGLNTSFGSEKLQTSRRASSFVDVRDSASGAQSLNNSFLELPPHEYLASDEKPTQVRPLQHDCLVSRGAHYCSEGNIRAFKDLLIRSVRKELSRQDKIVLQKMHALINDCRIEHHVADTVLVSAYPETPQSNLDSD